MSNEVYEQEIERLHKELLGVTEMLAMVLNETGPVEIDKARRSEIPEKAGVMVDINAEAGTVTLSLVDDNAGK